MGAGDKPDYYSVKANVVFTKKDNALYQACAGENCNKKVQETGNGRWRLVSNLDVTVPDSWQLMSNGNSKLITAVHLAISSTHLSPFQTIHRSNSLSYQHYPSGCSQGRKQKFLTLAILSKSIPNYFLKAKPLIYIVALIFLDWFIRFVTLQLQSLS